MKSNKKILIVGGGIAGMSAAIAMAKTGAEITLIDQDPSWRVYGAGITITGPTLRAMRMLGVLDGVVEKGHTANGISVFTQSGDKISSIDTPPVAGEEDLDGAGGILRPVLHKIMGDIIKASDMRVKLGVTVQIEKYGTPVTVKFSDGEREDFDLVVGADGIFSQIRKDIFPDSDDPAPTGQGCWRLMMERPQEIDHRFYYLGGPVKVGLTPVSSTHMYLFLLEPVRQQRYDETLLHKELYNLLEGYGGAIADIRTTLTENSEIVYRPLETVLAPYPWHKDGVLLIGDAAHATTPQLASGAGMAMEDGIVLGEELGKNDQISDVLDAFINRRYDRCSLVVENSIALGKLEMASDDPSKNQAIIENALSALAEPF